MHKAVQLNGAAVQDHTYFFGLRLRYTCFTVRIVICYSVTTPLSISGRLARVRPELDAVLAARALLGALKHLEYLKTGENIELTSP